jgi:predicted acetyltransferase
MLLDRKIRFSHVRYHSDLEKLFNELEKDIIQLSNYGFRLSSFLTLSGEGVDLYLVRTERRMEFLIYLSGTNICVGQINYENNCSDGFRKFWGDVSYDVLEQYRGNGYAGKALRVMAEYLYNNENVDSLYINVFNDNVPSIKTVEKFGGELYLDERGKLCYRCDLANILDKDKIDKGQSRK